VFDARKFPAGMALLLILFAAAAGSFAAPAAADDGEPASPPDSLAAPGVPMTGSGTEDDPYVLDVDALLEGGYGLIVAAEDSIPFAEGTSDTVLIEAPRVGVAEIVRRIGEKMERDDLATENMSFTSLTTVLARKHGEIEPGRKDEWTIYESADRVTRAEGGVNHTARLWSRERKFEDGELVEEKIEDDIEADWGSITEAAGNVPFSLVSGDAYDYTIEDRILIGRHLVYAVGFAPRSRFKPLPSGTVWIDWNDFGIRRMEGSLEGAMPLPVVIKAFPFFRFRQRNLDGRWVPQDLVARIELRRVLPGVPSEIEFSWRVVDLEIDGVAYPDPEGIPIPTGGGR